MLHSAVSDPSLHCLIMSNKEEARLIYVLMQMQNNILQPASGFIHASLCKIQGLLKDSL